MAEVVTSRGAVSGGSRAQAKACGRAVLCAALCCLAAQPGRAAGAPPSDLSQASLEELMNIDVTSVSRKDQKLSHTAAAVYVVSQDDIRRSGATSIPEALRMVPGVQVARIDSGRWVVSARGFDSRFSNKMLVLIDGRSIYNNAFAGVSWDQYDLVMEDIERIEVVRGPGATMWGANAVNGVVNIITRKASASQGLLLSATTGTEDLSTNAMRYGGKAGDRLHYRVFGKQFTRNHMLTESLGDARDSWNAVRGGARLDFDWTEHDSLSFQGDLYQGGAGQRYYSAYLTTDARYLHENRIAMSGGYLMGSWQHHHESGAETGLQVYYSGENRAEALAAMDMRTLDFDFQQRLPAFHRHELMWGLGYRSYWDRSTHPAMATFSPADRQTNLYSAFVQDEISVLPERLVLTLGAKLQHNQFTGVDVQPSVRAFWEPRVNNAFWAAVSSAVRTPSRRDSDSLLRYQIVAPSPFPTYIDFAGNPNLSSETVRAYELGYRTQFGGRVALDVTGFRNDYTNLQSLSLGSVYVAATPAPSIIIPVTFAYNGRARAYGAEAATTWTLNRSWKLTGNYAWLRTRVRSAASGGVIAPVASLANVYASHQSFLRSSLALSRRWSTDTTLYYLSGMHGNPVHSNLRLDVRVSWKASELAEWSFGAANLLDPQHPEFLPDSYDVRAQIPRSVYLRFCWGR